MLKDSLKKAMLKYAPELAKDYKEFIKSQFKHMKAELGSSLKGVYSSRRWARNFSVIRGSLNQKVEGKVFEQKITYSIDSAKLNKNAKEYGKRVALEWYNKMILKLGPLDKAKVVYRSSGGDITVTGGIQGNSIRIDQQRIINISSQGTLFHQFPARIYVNGKFMSESNYKKQLRKWNVPEPVRVPTKKRVPIDPDTRPKSYKFEFKVDRPKTPQRPHGSKGELMRDQAKGMSEKEAWNKIYKHYAKDMLQPYNYYTKIYSPKVIAIFAWNGKPLWRRK